LRLIEWLIELCCTAVPASSSMPPSSGVRSPPSCFAFAIVFAIVVCIVTRSSLSLPPSRIVVQSNHAHKVKPRAYCLSVPWCYCRVRRIPLFSFIILLLLSCFFASLLLANLLLFGPVSVSFTHPRCRRVLLHPKTRCPKGEP
jgi:hypothetical protein